MKLTVSCTGDRLYGCPNGVSTTLDADDVQAPVTLAPAFLRLISLMDTYQWMRLNGPIPAGYCSTCADRLTDLAAGVTGMRDVDMLYQLLLNADMAADSMDTILGWDTKGRDHAAHMAAKRIIATRRKGTPA